MRNTLDWWAKHSLASGHHGTALLCNVVPLLFSFRFLQLCFFFVCLSRNPPTRAGAQETGQLLFGNASAPLPLLVQASVDANPLSTRASSLPPVHVGLRAWAQALHIMLAPLSSAEKAQHTITRRLGVIACYLCIVVVYLIAGGGVMHAFEGNTEADGVANRQAYVSKHLANGNLTREMMDDMEDLGLCTFPLHGRLQHWTFTGGVFYSLTVITTIGYGTFAPVTLGGRTFTVFYAMFGISVIGILLSNLAMVTAELAQSVVLRWWPRDVRRSEWHMKTAQQCLASTDPIGTAELKSMIIALLEIHEADWDERHEGVAFSDVCHRYEDVNGQFDRGAVIRAFVRWHEIHLSRPAKVTKRLLSLLFSICLVWILVWSLVFHKVEGWGFFDSMWYAVVTLSTIGFGDFVPATISGRLCAFAFIAPGIGMVAAFLSCLTNWFEFWRFWSLQRLYSRGKVSEKTMVAQGLSISLKPRDGVHKVPVSPTLLPEPEPGPDPLPPSAPAAPASSRMSLETSDNASFATRLTLRADADADATAPLLMPPAVSHTAAHTASEESELGSGDCYNPRAAGGGGGGGGGGARRSTVSGAGDTVAATPRSSELHDEFERPANSLLHAAALPGPPTPATPLRARRSSVLSRNSSSPTAAAAGGAAATQDSLARAASGRVARERGGGGGGGGGRVGAAPELPLYATVGSLRPATPDVLPDRDIRSPFTPSFGGSVKAAPEAFSSLSATYTTHTPRTPNPLSADHARSISAVPSPRDLATSLGSPLSSRPSPRASGPPVIAAAPSFGIAPNRNRRKTLTSTSSPQARRTNSLSQLKL